MTSERPIIVKLGGAVITRKHRSAQVRPKVLARLATELGSAPGPVLLVHGAGSFGHPAAKRFRLNRRPETGSNPRERARGAAIVSREVRRLHLQVLGALVDAGSRPWSVPPAGCCSQSGGRLIRFDERPVQEALDRGLLPVSFGDVVPDEEWGFSILSGDTIMVELARRFHPTRAIFVSDVEGVYHSLGPGPRVVVDPLDATAVARLGHETGGTDVTGGVRGKAEAMLAIAGLGADAGLISGLKDGALSRALRGEPVYGSWSRAATG